MKFRGHRKEISQGYRLATPEETQFHFKKAEAATPLKKAEAFSLGAMRALTFGGSDLGLTATGIYTPEELREKEALNKPASIAGETTAILGSLLAPGYGEAVAGSRVLGTAARIATAPVRGVTAATQALGRGAVATLPEAATAMGRIGRAGLELGVAGADRKCTRLNSSHRT